ncbi:MAG TPA: SgcJ/EcaC family oxidoreductase [Iamia sp.]
MLTTAPAPTHDIAAIEALLDDVAAGIAAQDPDRCVARFAVDARSVNTAGQRGVGRDAIRAAHVASFAAGILPATPRFALLDVVFVRPDVAIATTGAYANAPDEPVDLDAPPTVVTWTLVREDDGWWIAARQFTRVEG